MPLHFPYDTDSYGIGILKLAAQFQFWNPKLEFVSTLIIIRGQQPPNEKNE